MKSFWTACLVLMVMSSNGAVRASEIDACYGETLEIQIHMFAPDQPNGGEVIMSLPNPASWTLIARDGRGSLHDAGCQEEPVPVSQAYSSGMQHKFAVALKKAGAPRALEGGVALTLIGGLRQSVSEGLYKGNYLPDSEWLPVANGFRRLNSKGDRLIMSYHGRRFAAGTFYFPDHYLAPQGHPISARCSWFGFCQVDYRLHERLGVRYKFRSSVDYDTRWIPQDQALRALINSWVVSPVATE
ncbi:hypothetical protein [Roseovarius sp. 2305UL8-3]|uniref:hypothetical protein n=1 Tax=Roseovarius conchicola TaxID=3121636 RepID=UPI0035279EDD